MTTIYLIRHGVTAANREDRFAGRTQEPVLPEGESGLRVVAERLQGRNIEGIFTGPLTRTRQSAECIGSVIKAPVTLLDELNDICIPHWDGLAKDEIRKKFGDEYPKWKADPANCSMPGCENLAAVQDRAVFALERIFKEFRGGAALIVTHLVVARCLVLYCQGRNLEEYRRVSIENGAVLEIRRNKTETRVSQLSSAVG